MSSLFHRPSLPSDQFKNIGISAPVPRPATRTLLEPRVELLDLLAHATEVSFVGRANKAVTGISKSEGYGVYDLLSGKELSAQAAAEELDRTFLVGVVKEGLRNKSAGVVGVRTGDLNNGSKRITMSIIPPSSLQDAGPQYRDNANGGAILSVSVVAPKHVVDAFGSLLSKPDGFPASLKAFMNTSLGDSAGIIASKLRDGVLAPLARQRSENIWTDRPWNQIAERSQDAALRSFVACNLAVRDWVASVKDFLRQAGALA